MKSLGLKLGLWVLCLASPLLAQDKPAESLTTVQNNLKQKKAVLLDVRTPDEWKAGHLQDARHLPLQRIQEGITRDDLKPGKIVYIHCRSGGRARVAAEILSKQGYDARPLKAGFDELVKAGFPAAPKTR